MPQELSQLMNYGRSEETEEQKSEFQLIGIPEFVKQFREHAMHAQTRAWLQTMYLFPSHFSDLLINGLTESKKNNVDARLYTDGLQSPLRLRNKLYATFRGNKSDKTVQHHATEFLDEDIRTAGVQTIESRPFTSINYLLFSYLRNHFKLAIVDDVAWVGGLNAGKDSDYNRIDFMMKFNSKEFVEALSQIVEQQNQMKHDEHINVDGIDILVDRGAPGESIIYQTVIDKLTAIKDPSQATVTILSPWVPDGQMLKLLHELHQAGANIQVLTSFHKFKFEFEGIYAMVKNFNNLMMRLRQLQIPLLYTPLEVHGKMLSITEGDQQYSMITSHNLVDKGVKMGTTEIAVGTSQDAFTRQCDNFIAKVRAVSTEKPQ